MREIGVYSLVHCLPGRLAKAAAFPGQPCLWGLATVLLQAWVILAAASFL